MQKLVSQLKGSSVGATDGDIGSVEDFLFDDKLWTVRYLVADTAKWLLSAAMLAGRLEVLALLVAFDRDFWRF